MAFNDQSQPPPGYNDIDEYERRIRSDVERRLRENNERMLKAIVEQWSQSITFRKVNVVITLSLGKEIDNHVGDNLNEKSNTPPTTAVDNSREFKEDKPTVTVTTPPKTAFTFPMQVQKPIAGLKGEKDQEHIDKIKETFSQVKINIPLLDTIHQMPPYAKFLKVLCTAKSTAVVPKRAFLASNVRFVISS